MFKMSPPELLPQLPGSQNAKFDSLLSPIVISQETDLVQLKSMTVMVINVASHSI